MDFYNVFARLGSHYVQRLGSDPNNMLALHSSGIYHILWYNPVSLKKDRTSSMLTFSNKSLKLFTLKNHFLVSEKAPHSMRMCLMVQGIWRVKHCGYCSYLSIKE